MDTFEQIYSVLLFENAHSTKSYKVLSVCQGFARLYTEHTGLLPLMRWQLGREQYEVLIRIHCNHYGSRGVQKEEQVLWKRWLTVLGKDAEERSQFNLKCEFILDYEKIHDLLVHPAHTTFPSHAHTNAVVSLNPWCLPCSPESYLIMYPPAVYLRRLFMQLLIHFPLFFYFPALTFLWCLEAGRLISGQ